jgi:hypothetical protein
VGENPPRLLLRERESSRTLHFNVLLHRSCYTSDKSECGKAFSLHVTSFTSVRATHLQHPPIAFYVPLHTASRLVAHLVALVRRLNPRAHLCFYRLSLRSTRPICEG